MTELNDRTSAGWPTAAALRLWQEMLADQGERRLVLVEGNAADARSYARDYAATVGQSASGQTLWVGDKQPGLGSVTLIPAHQASRWLGRELDLVVWDGWQGTPPDAFAAIAGTLRAGGLLIWLMPPLDQWPTFADPDYPRTGLADTAHHPFAAHLASVIAGDPSVLRLNREGMTPSDLSLPAASVGFCPGDTPCQQQAIARIIRTGEGRRRRPLVVRADRGRGKSTALGRAAVHLLRDKRERVIVTAPRAEAVDHLFSAAQAAWPEASRTPFSLATNGRELVFIPADVLLRERPAAELILVDEAAGLPAPLLESILASWPRVVFATTVHGYEGTGRGFDVRFREVLDRLTPQWQSCRLIQPIRWRSGDPLEHLVSRLFLLDADSASLAESSLASQVTIERWQPAQADLAELRQAFGLLTDAHYRTTPGDLRQWLDDVQAQSWIARADEGAIVGVLWLTREGGLDAAMAKSVMRGERRPRGHLLAQSLASHGALAEAAMARMARVVRIAVHADLRSQGGGRQLVEAARQAIGAEGLDLFGTSFGATPALLRFWQGCGLKPLRLGLHRAASSGEFTVQMGAPLSADGQQVIERLAVRFAEHWPWLLVNEFADLDVALVWALTDSWGAAPSLSVADRSELMAFSEGSRQFELSRLPLLRLSLQAGVAGNLAQADSEGLWCRAVLQHWRWEALQTAGACSGRKQGERVLRDMARSVLAWLDQQ
ncbi:GNAT family N-acetyltransferase [Marinobacter sp. BGYM27]|uniref:tRNA(Met) cytidine acetyltransferase TmcA n=1 Tax=Marinobacter sp. BGYM27 TaxID=2975597 RepID=UPI0021A7B599|nr:GNAT family N-acetyltransferase [Marinobacter sp. BGYM27]